MIVSCTVQQSLWGKGYFSEMVDEVFELSVDRYQLESTEGPAVASAYLGNLNKTIMTHCANSSKVKFSLKVQSSYKPEPCSCQVHNFTNLTSSMLFSDI